MKFKTIFSVAIGIPAFMVACGEPEDPTNFWAVASQVIAFGVLIGILAINGLFTKGFKNEN